MFNTDDAILIKIFISSN